MSGILIYAAAVLVLSLLAAIVVRRRLARERAAWERYVRSLPFLRLQWQLGEITRQFGEALLPAVQSAARAVSGFIAAWNAPIPPVGGTEGATDA